uniref:Putative secreted protein n=1 Tax=Anopheles darlingi TaxID=43151 RepID=A0A2M4DG93_ANODA
MWPGLSGWLGVFACPAHTMMCGHRTAPLVCVLGTLNDFITSLFFYLRDRNSSTPIASPARKCLFGGRFNVAGSLARWLAGWLADDEVPIRDGGERIIVNSVCAMRS